MSSDAQTYWAAEPDSERFVAYALARIDRYQNWFRGTGQARRASRAWRTRYGWAPDGWGDTSQLQATGEQGEWIQLTLNDFAMLHQQAVVMVCGNRPTFKAIANNRDYRSQAQCALGDALVESYDRKQQLSEREEDCVSSGLLCGNSWSIQGWDPNAGRNLMPAAGVPVTEGEFWQQTFTPFDVAFDPDCPSPDALTWIFHKRPVNRWDLIKQYPELENELSAASILQNPGDGFSKGRETQWKQQNAHPDTVYMWEGRFLPSPALPQGRFVQFVHAKAVLYDSITTDDAGTVSDYGYPYGDDLHAYPLNPSPVTGSMMGHSEFFDLESLQECLDLVATQYATAVNASGVTNYWTPDGEIPIVEQMAGGGNFVVSKTKPELIEGMEVTPVATAFFEMVRNAARQRVGFNDAALGEPTKGMPAQLAALMQSQAVQFHSRLQAGYTRLVERTRGGLLKLLKRFAKSKRVALIGGVSNDWTLKEWQSEDIEAVDRVTVESVAPALRTTAGRMALADSLLQRGAITPEHYILLATTGQIRPMTDKKVKMEAAVQREVELMQQGIGLPPIDPAKSKPGMPFFVAQPGQTFVNPIVMEPHWLYIDGALELLNSPEAKEVGGLVTAVQNVIQRRMELWTQMPVKVQMMLGCPEALLMLPPPPVNATPMPGPGPTTGTAPPKPGEQSQSVPAGDGKPIHLPKPPKGSEMSQAQMAGQ